MKRNRKQLNFRRIGEFSLVLGLPAVMVLTAAMLLRAAPASSEAVEPLPSSALLQSTPAYVGSQRCRLCHQDIGINFQQNPHAETTIEVEGTERTGCETCHGGGGDHVGTMDPDRIRRFDTGNAGAESQVCLGCHSREATHPDRFFDMHEAASVGCTSCHSIHTPEEPLSLLEQRPNQLCADCHPSEAARFLQPFAHQIDSGAMFCIDCHAPHGSLAEFQLVRTNANESACMGCHSDKRGPFAFEHMPAAVGGCDTCHEPHGSPNPRMLVRHQVRFVCLECHTNSRAAFGATPPAFHDLRSSRFENCTLCHTKIHGSHLSPALLR